MAEGPRVHTLQFRVSTHEKAAIEARAAVSGQKVSEFLRNLGLGELSESRSKEPPGLGGTSADSLATRKRLGSESQEPKITTVDVHDVRPDPEHGFDHVVKEVVVASPDETPAPAAKLSESPKLPTCPECGAEKGTRMVGGRWGERGCRNAWHEVLPSLPPEQTMAEAKADYVRRRVKLLRPTMSEAAAKQIAVAEWESR